MFKVGDVVRCAVPGPDANLLKIGKIYAILECTMRCGAQLIRVQENGPFLFMDRFDLVEIPMKKSHLPDWM